MLVLKAIESILRYVEKNAGTEGKGRKKEKETGERRQRKLEKKTKKRKRKKRKKGTAEGKERKDPQFPRCGSNHDQLIRAVISANCFH